MVVKVSLAVRIDEDPSKIGAHAHWQRVYTEAPTAVAPISSDNTAPRPELSEARAAAIKRIETGGTITDT